MVVVLETNFQLLLMPVNLSVSFEHTHKWLYWISWHWDDRIFGKNHVTSQYCSLQRYKWILLCVYYGWNAEQKDWKCKHISFYYKQIICKSSSHSANKLMMCNDLLIELWLILFTFIIVLIEWTKHGNNRNIQLEFMACVLYWLFQ